MMDLAAIMPWVGAALSIIALLTQLKNMLTADERKLDDRLSKAEKTLIDHDRRIQTVENDLKHLPDIESQHRLEIAMEKISGELGVLKEQLKPIDVLARRLNEVLIERAK